MVVECQLGNYEICLWCAFDWLLSLNLNISINLTPIFPKFLTCYLPITPALKQWHCYLLMLRYGVVYQCIDVHIGIKE